jgi:hypothetical protein
MKVTPMISDNLTQDYEPSYTLIEYEEGDSIPIIFNYRHGIVPLIKLFYGYDSMLMPHNRSWVAVHKVHPPLGEGTDSNDWMERGWM